MNIPLYLGTAGWLFTGLAFWIYCVRHREFITGSDVIGLISFLIAGPIPWAAWVINYPWKIRNPFFRK